jgi:hypothetical protein
MSTNKNLAHACVPLKKELREKSKVSLEEVKKVRRKQRQQE